MRKSRTQVNEGKAPSKKQIRRAGDLLAGRKAGAMAPADKTEALAILGYWRAVHMDPLHKTLDLLESVCGRDESTILVSRLKRLESIIDKLRRSGHRSDLSQMQDLAGCRLIVPHDDDVRRMANEIGAAGVSIRKDYLTVPQDSGYRGMHLICRHDAAGYQGLRVEIQIRSRLQHAWATGVETYDLIARGNLKAGEGKAEERRYFQILSALMNPGLEDERTLREELQAIDRQLNIYHRLRAAENSMFIQDSDKQICRAGSCLLTVNTEEQTINLEVYSAQEEAAAADKYTELESPGQVGRIYLLARAASREHLEIAFPNYFSGIREFMAQLKGLLQ